MAAVILDLSGIATLTREELYELCAQNPEMKLEPTAKGELVIMSPRRGETGSQNFRISGELYLWNRNTGKD